MSEVTIRNWEKMKFCPECSRMFFEYVIDSIEPEPDGKKMCPKCGEYVDFATIRTRSIYHGSILNEIEIKEDDATDEIKGALLKKTNGIKYTFVR